MTPKIGTGDGGHIDLAVSVQWKAVTSINYVKQSFEAEVDITVVAIGAVRGVHHFIYFISNRALKCIST